MKTLGLISCTSKKKDDCCKASVLYSASALFTKAYAYCIKTYDYVVILSAKYGLVFPDDELEPYDKTLNDMSVRKRKDWSRNVFSQMKARLNLSDIEGIFFHAGERYREYLIPELEDLGIKCEAPLENLRIGEQLRWYDTHDC